MFAAKLNDWFKWLFGILCVYVIGTLFFWDYSPHSTSIGEHSAVVTDSLLSVIYQSHQVFHGRTKQAASQRKRYYSTRDSDAQHLLLIEYVNGSWTGRGLADRAAQVEVVIFSSCSKHTEREPHNIHFHDIYAYYDSVIRCAESLVDAYPHSVLVWAIPVSLFANGNGQDYADLHALHNYLTLEHLIKRRGVLVMPRGARNETVLQLSHEELLLLHGQLVFIDQRIMAGNAATTLNSTLITIAQHQRASMRRAAAELSSLHAQCAKYVPTRRYHTHCHPPSALAHPLLITGLGGAGTHFVAQRLRSVGWRVLHEDIDVDGSVVSDILVLVLNYFVLNITYLYIISVNF